MICDVGLRDRDRLQAGTDERSVGRIRRNVEVAGAVDDAGADDSVAKRKRDVVADLTGAIEFDGAVIGGDADLADIGDRRGVDVHNVPG